MIRGWVIDTEMDDGRQPRAREKHPGTSTWKMRNVQFSTETRLGSPSLHEGMSTWISPCGSFYLA